MMASATTDRECRLMYKPFSSILNPSFWQQLTNIKLNHLMLSKEPISVNGTYSSNLSENLPCLASFDHSSFCEVDEIGNKSTSPLFGKLICTNIMQEFIDFDKREFLDSIGKQIWTSILNGDALKNPEENLSRFGLIVYADLKKYKYYYWFCFPAVNYPTSSQITIERVEGSTGDNPTSITDVFSDEALQMFQEGYEKPPNERKFQKSYFIVKHFTNSSTKIDEVLLFPLDQYEAAKQSSEEQKNSAIYFAFNDPSADKVYPGWPLRNYLCLIATALQLEDVKIIRIRKGMASNKSKVELHHSLILHVKCSIEGGGSVKTEMPLITGWEKNESQQLAPKSVGLSSLLDPKRLAEDAVNLNLRLMKWRLLPGLDLEKIANTKCLILGCGTLGCHVARGLLAWGVKNISIVDNSKISYSNPVRQTLYTFDDCANSSAPFKAHAAAASLRRIHPSVNVKSYVFSIPMPGHHVADSVIEQTKENVAQLEKLIEEHDAIYLLMDTRESRWLPTVIAKSKRKLVINAAIGFDTFLLQRYGLSDYSENPPEQTSSELASGNSGDSSNFLPSESLGCYFCNDIVAPGDSTLDRTLDQQCTVSRPGVSMMVSAMAVELLASIVSSRLGPSTPAPLDTQSDPSMASDSDCGSELGIVPHSIRGNLARYHIYMPTSPSFNKCSACSKSVVQAYRMSGYKFLHNVFDDPSYLEEVAGLKDLQNVSDNVWALESDEEIEGFECAQD